MNLDLFNNLINSTKDNKVIKNFIKELGEFLENNQGGKQRKEKPLLQKILHGKTLTTMYRDKINLERHEIINNYSKKHSEQGEFYYVYSKRSNNTYGLVSHKNGETGINIGIKESQLPEGAGVDSVLRMKKGKFILDKDTTKEIQEELTKMINRLLEEQSKRINLQRIEGNCYEFVEKIGNTVELINITNYTGECFEEIDLPQNILDKVKKGDILKYVNGKYQL